MNLKDKGLTTDQVELVRDLLKSFNDNVSEISHYPTVLKMDLIEDGLNTKEYTNRKKQWDVEDLLGKYDADQGIIYLYTNSIRTCAADIIGLSEQDLTTIVLLHETGHWITHKLPYDVGAWKNNEHYLESRKNNREIHEGWAQLITYWSIKENPKLKESFIKLNKRQSGPYKVWSNHGFNFISFALVWNYGSRDMGLWKYFDRLILENPEKSLDEIRHMARGVITGRKLNII